MQVWAYDLVATNNHHNRYHRLHHSDIRQMGSAMKIKVTIVTENNFKDEASYLEWKRVMQTNLSIVDFDLLEKNGNYTIKSGDKNDGSASHYTIARML